MKIRLSSNNEDFYLTISDKNSESRRFWCSKQIFRPVLDHAWIKKQDVYYSQADKTLTIKLRRHDENSKARKKFLGSIFWINTIPPNRPCLLRITDIENCDIYDEEPTAQEVIIGGILLDGQEIYIGAYCQHEEPYGITLKVERINITLEDIIK